MNEFTEQANQTTQTEANEQAAATFASETGTTVDLAQGFEVWIDDEDDNAVPLANDDAKRVLIAAGIPVVGLPKSTGIEGSYHVDVPQAWYDELVASGDDFDAQVTVDSLVCQVHAWQL